MKRKALLSLVVFSVMASTGLIYRTVRASDHDDGETDVKSRALNLTDHYVYKENASNLIFQMNSNPRSLPHQQYFFSTQGRYEMHVSRVGSTDAEKAAAPAGSDDMIFRFEFGAPNAADVQGITFTVIKDGATVGSDATGTTTNFNDSFANTAGSLVVNSVSVGGQTYAFFAGHREDTFFFDVERFFQVRSFLIDKLVNGNTSATLAHDCTGPGGTAIFNPTSCAPDFTKNYNVNAIVLRVPITALQSAAATETTFDTWDTISIPQ